MSSKLYFLALFLLLPSVFLISSATPIADVELQERGCPRFACRIIVGTSSDSGTFASEPTLTANSSVAAPAATSSSGTSAPPAATTPPSQDSASTPKNSGAFFNANVPVFSCIVTLSATATIFTLVL